MKLPKAVHEFFAADRGREADALVAILSPGAVVKDEGKTHEGIDAICAWWLAAKQKYQHVAEPIDVSQEGETVQVRARVTGRFPGSPATLQYLFTVQGDRIASLRIGV